MMGPTFLLPRIKKIATQAGREVLVVALTLWYCLRDADTPFRIKSMILGDLAYFLSPVDVIPDMIPVAGFSDDMAVMAATLVLVARHIKPTHREQARDTVVEWLGV